MATMLTTFKPHNILTITKLYSEFQHSDSLADVWHPHVWYAHNSGCVSNKLHFSHTVIQTCSIHSSVLFNFSTHCITLWWDKIAVWQKEENWTVEKKGVGGTMLVWNLRNRNHPIIHSFDLFNADHSGTGRDQNSRKWGQKGPMPNTTPVSYTHLTLPTSDGV